MVQPNKNLYKPENMMVTDRPQDGQWKIPRDLSAFSQLVSRPARPEVSIFHQVVQSLIGAID